ncbi:MAG TPA: hypothetical protein VHN74_04785 [Candidatus Angelobacter sp.]|nr:hypothetical protein [Candidatus Angelobacter sp.]
MFSNKFVFTAALLGALSLGAGAQTSPQGESGGHEKLKSSVPDKRPAKGPLKLNRQQKFVVDTVKMAVALPQPDPQDRLRVLSTAANVVSPIDRKMAKQLWQEGVRVESDLIRVGQTPAVSLMATGQADCASATNFVENLPENVAVQAEQSLIGAVTSCPKQTLDLVARKLDAALDKDIVAPRALMAVMEVQGHNAPASQQRFDKMFRSLPDAGKNSDEAENFAAMYAQMAPDVDKELAAKAGLELLAWLGKVKDSPVRTLAINITTGAMQQALGEEAFRKALEKDVVAQSTVQNAGEPREIERPQEDTVSVLEAMDNVGTDRTDALRGLPPVQRARQAAANGFAAGTSGKKDQAAKYFDMAFSAVDDVWDARTPKTDAAAVVQEVGEAAAQVDSVNALTRAQKLRDSSAQAIAMLAVARVVASSGLN